VTEENHEKQSAYPICGSRFEPEASAYKAGVLTSVTQRCLFKAVTRFIPKERVAGSHEVFPLSCNNVPLVLRRVCWQTCVHGPQKA